MRKIKTISILVVLCLIASIICPLAMNKAQAKQKKNIKGHIQSILVQNYNMTAHHMVTHLL